MIKPAKPRFRRAPQEERRLELIEATLAVIASHGLQAASIRTIAAQTRVSAGLIRHYFSSKEDMIHQAYRVLVARMVDQVDRQVAIETEPKARMRAYVLANLSPPLLDSGFMRQWAMFVAQAHLDRVMAEIHHDGYLRLRTLAEGLICDLLATMGPRPEGPTRDRLAVALGALLDGLWLEGCLQTEAYEELGIYDIALQATERLLGVSLT